MWSKSQRCEASFSRIWSDSVFGLRAHVSDRAHEGPHAPELSPSACPVEETFDVGLASTKGIFKICFCPSSDLADKDEQTCSSEEEHFALDGYLAVDTVRGEERHPPL